MKPEIPPYREATVYWLPVLFLAIGLVSCTPNRELIISEEVPHEVLTKEETRNKAFDPQKKRRSIAPVFGYELNSEDWVFLGGGITITDYGSTHPPYRSKNTALFLKSLFTRAFIATYEGHFTRNGDKWDRWIQAKYYDHNNIRNFYGFGNNADGSSENRRRYRAQYSQLIIEPRLSNRLSSFQTLDVGGRIEYTNVNPIPGITPGDEAGMGYAANDLKEKIYAAITLSYTVDSTDSLIVTRSGMRWINNISLNQAMYNANRRYLALQSEFSFFYPVVPSGDVSFAFRVGGGRHWGRFEFLQARYISGRMNVRGYEKNRFAGHSNFYNNYELRGRLFTPKVLFLEGDGGVLAFFDHGRVWSDEDTGHAWHAGYGGGIWGIPLPNVVVSAIYGISKEGGILDFFLRFLF